MNKALLIKKQLVSSLKIKDFGSGSNIAGITRIEFALLYDMIEDILEKAYNKVGKEFDCLGYLEDRLPFDEVNGIPSFYIYGSSVSGELAISVSIVKICPRIAKGSFIQISIIE